VDDVVAIKARVNIYKCETNSFGVLLYAYIPKAAFIIAGAIKKRFCSFFFFFGFLRTILLPFRGE